MGISVIMASYLGEYPGSRKDPVDKFIRAVKSFLNNTLNEKELIIVSDGCEITNTVYEKHFKNFDNIKLVRVEKREHSWPGELRECGRSIAKYEWITYLDADDYYLRKYLQVLLLIIKENPDHRVFTSTQIAIPIPSDDQLKQWPYFIDISPWGTLNEFRAWRDSKNRNGIIFKSNDIEFVLVQSKSTIGTWCLTHNKYVSSRWRNSKEMGEDANFIQSLIKSENVKSISCPGYMICHITKVDNRDNIVWEF